MIRHLHWLWAAWNRDREFCLQEGWWGKEPTSVREEQEHREAQQGEMLTWCYPTVHWHTAGWTTGSCWASWAPLSSHCSTDPSMHKAGGLLPLPHPTGGGLSMDRSLLAPRYCTLLLLSSHRFEYLRMVEPQVIPSLALLLLLLEPIAIRGAVAPCIRAMLVPFHLLGHCFVLQQLVLQFVSMPCWLWVIYAFIMPPGSAVLLKLSPFLCCSFIPLGTGLIYL